MELDSIFHQPVRTQIVALLIREGSADYTLIKKELEITDGHMSTHMKTLTEADYVDVKKEFINNKPKTTYRMSSTGKKKFQEYVKQLKALISL